MTDRREQILSRLETVLSGVNADWQVFRNKEDLTEKFWPAFVLFDGGEERDPIGEKITVQTNGLARVKMGPRVAIYVAGAPEDVGPRLNEMRLAALGSIFLDVASKTSGALGAILTPSGAVFYDGCGTMLDRGLEMTGEMVLSLSFFYPLLPFEF